MIYLMMCKNVAYFLGEHNMNICTFAHENAAEGMGEWVKGAKLAGKSANS